MENHVAFHQKSPGHEKARYFNAFLSTEGQTQNLCQCLKQGFCILAPEIVVPCSVILKIVVRLFSPVKTWDISVF